MASMVLGDNFALLSSHQARTAIWAPTTNCTVTSRGTVWAEPWSSVAASSRRTRSDRWLQTRRRFRAPGLIVAEVITRMFKEGQAETKGRGRNRFLLSNQQSAQLVKARAL